MPLQTSGAISINDIATEFGGTVPHSLSEYYAGGGLVPAGTSGTNGAVPSSGAISLSNFYGSSNLVPVLYAITISTTWTVPTTGKYTFTLIGGGGGGGTRYGGPGGGGGGGNLLQAERTLTQGQILTTIIGAGGAGSPAGYSYVGAERGGETWLYISGVWSYLTYGGWRGGQYDDNDSSTQQKGGSGGGGGGAGGTIPRQYGYPGGRIGENGGGEWPDYGSGVPSQALLVKPYFALDEGGAAGYTSDYGQTGYGGYGGDGFGGGGGGFTSSSGGGGGGGGIFPFPPLQWVGGSGSYPNGVQGGLYPNGGGGRGADGVVLIYGPYP